MPSELTLPVATVGDSKLALTSGTLSPERFAQNARTETINDNVEYFISVTF
jgi:hypothetical protein